MRTKEENAYLDGYVMGLFHAASDARKLADTTIANGWEGAYLRAESLRHLAETIESFASDKERVEARAMPDIRRRAERAECTCGHMRSRHEGGRCLDETEGSTVRDPTVRMVPCPCTGFVPR